MHKASLLVSVLLVARVAVAQDGAAPPARGIHPSRGPAPEAPLRLPPREAFRLFPQVAADLRIDVSDLDDRRLFHQAGDPDSLFTIGAATPQGRVHLRAAIELNEIFLKAIAPDPLVSSSDTRPRAAGSFLPFDGERRPYQLRLGARLVW